MSDIIDVRIEACCVTADTADSKFTGDYGQKLKLTGRLPATGTLSLEFYDAAGTLVGEEPLQAVDQQLIPVPDEVFRKAGTAHFYIITSGERSTPFSTTIPYRTTIHEIRLLVMKRPKVGQ